jgi:hypothetical protein
LALPDTAWHIPALSVHAEIAGLPGREKAVGRLRFRDPILSVLLQVTHKYGSVRLVKTTLGIPDPLFRKAKATAAQQGRSMKEYVVEALTEKLAGTGKEQGWRSVFGKLSAEGKRAARAVDSVIKAADFNKVDPEAWQ